MRKYLWYGENMRGTEPHLGSQQSFPRRKTQAGPPSPKLKGVSQTLVTEYLFKGLKTR